MKIIMTGLLSAAIVTAAAQLPYQYEKAANAYYAKGDYYSAAQYYEKLVSGNEKGLGGDYDPYHVQTLKGSATPAISKKSAAYRLAECYRMLHYPARAAQWYLFVSDKYGADYPLARFYDAECLMQLQQAEEAEKCFHRFLKEYTGKDSYVNKAQQELQNLAFARQQLGKDTSGYMVRKMPSAAGAVTNYAPALLHDTLLFTAAVAGAGGTVRHINHVFQAIYKDGQPENITPVDMPQTGDMHQGVVSITGDGNTLYVTQWAVADGKKQAAIYRSKRLVKGWSKPEMLEAPVNSTGSNNQQPFVSADGQWLYFASDRSGGMGGWDIWCASLNKAGKVTSCVNAGSSVNTPEDEQAPYYHQAAGALVFASNGRTGMGGFDLYYSKGAPGSFTASENAGYPVNSVKDDIYFAGAAGSKQLFEEALISSDRASDCCLDLFAVKLVTPPAVVAAPEPVHTTEAAPPGVISNKAPDPATETTTVIPDVYFALNEAVPLETSYPSLNRLVVYLQEHSTLVIEIGGHTDATGSEESNKKLSEARAKNVAEYLVGKGIASERVTYKGYGATVPVASNTLPDGSDNPEGRKLNRRTEYKVLRR